MNSEEEGSARRRLPTVGIAIIGIGLLLLALLLFVLVILFNAPAAQGFDGADLIGHRAPPYELLDYSQTVHSDAEWRGSPTLIVFWQAGDTNCEALLREIEPIFRAHAAAGFKAVAIEIRAQASRALPFLARHDLTYLFLEGIFQTAVDDWRIEGVPSTFIIDRDGFVRHYLAGRDDSTGARLVEAVGDLMKGAETR